MKKGLLFVAVVSAFSFASCKKDHTCTCTSVTTPSGGGSATTTVSTTIYNDAKKGDARAKCLNHTYDGSYGSITYQTVVTCELK